MASVIEMAQPRASAAQGAELIVVMRPEIGVFAPTSNVRQSADMTDLARLLMSQRAVLRPVFRSQAPVREPWVVSAPIPHAPQDIPPTQQEGPSLSRYFRVQGPTDLESFARELRRSNVVQAAYVKPAPTLPVLMRAVLPTASPPASRTPDLTGRQGYLEAAPVGVDARYAWTLPGGHGEDVRIIDIEGAWNFMHEDLLGNQGGVIGGTQDEGLEWRDHGTAVSGVFGADLNDFGVTGIAPAANERAISYRGSNGWGTGTAIAQAATALRPGDIILIELQRPGPMWTGLGDHGMIPLEWWPDDFDAIRYATGRGIIVVEAAGNGYQDLDDPIHAQPLPEFPKDWVNPFDRARADSGAILVGAGAPPEGTHESDWGPDRSRLDFSNFGAAIDAQGWGRAVTTCGYGDLQYGPNENQWYTDEFAGTSSASPIVVGAIACLQGVTRARGLAPFGPADIRRLLRATGSPQQDAQGRPATQRIGNRPDLRQLIP